MNKTDLVSLIPLWILSSAAILNFFSISIRRNHKVIFIITLVSLIVDFIFLVSYSIRHQQPVEPLLVFDGFGIFNIGLILLTTLIVTMMSYAYFEQREERKEEYYILIILAALGSCILVVSKHFASLFLGLEILSVSLYALIAYLRKRERSDEAGIKYLILAAFSSAFLLFGMALLYAATGTMSFQALADKLTATEQVSPLVWCGFGMLTVGNRLQARRSSIPHVDPRCLRRGARTGYCIYSYRFKRWYDRFACAFLHRGTGASICAAGNCIYHAGHCIYVCGQLPGTAAK